MWVPAKATESEINLTTEEITGITIWPFFWHLGSTIVLETPTADYQLVCGLSRGLALKRLGLVVGDPGLRVGVLARGNRPTRVLPSEPSP